MAACRGLRAGNLEPAKDKSGKRIYGIVALIMALGRAILPEEPQSCTRCSGFKPRRCDGVPRAADDVIDGHERQAHPDGTVDFWGRS